jgi:hypothetical protein
MISTASEYELAVQEVEVPILKHDLCNVWLQLKDLNVTEDLSASYAERAKTLVRSCIIILSYSRSGLR